MARTPGLLQLTQPDRRLESNTHRTLPALIHPHESCRTVSQPTFEASRADKLRRIEELGLDPWGARFDCHRPIAEIRGLSPEQSPPAKVRAAGRIVQRRIQGKVHFLDIWDWTGRIQVFLGQKQVGETGWALAQNLDLGDLLGVDGTFGRTKMGELTIFADAIHFLGKSLEPHPDKWAGMQDMEYRLRHRYLDLIYNPEVLERSLKRIRLIRCIRNYLDERGYLEVETPTLHAIAGGAAARPFITHHNALDIDLFLRIALELHLKRLLVGGIEKVYEIGRVFRNEGISPKHNPEFTMLELYQAYGDYGTMMELTEGLIVAAVKSLGGELKLPYGEKVIDRKRGNPAVAERFELYVQGMELANAYTELNDPVTQEATFRQQLAGLPEEDSMAKMDADFVRTLRHGMPPAGGLGIGIDRLVMLLTNTQTIRDVILFPLLRPV